MFSGVGAVLALLFLRGVGIVGHRPGQKEDVESDIADEKTVSRNSAADKAETF